MTETIKRHTCDQCGKIQDQGMFDASNYISVVDGFDKGFQSGAGSTPAIYVIKEPTKIFCCYNCVAGWANKRMEWERLTEGSR